MTATGITINQLTVKLVEPTKYEVYYNVNKIGNLIQDVDGYFYFVFQDNKGYWNNWILENIVLLLKAFNKPLEISLKNDLR